jgi:hypothetical protein
MEAQEFKDRKAPYAPVSAFEEFLDRIPNVSVPSRIDQGFLKKLNIARGNEWALLSALKFLGIIDPQGRPSAGYRRLVSTDTRQEALRHLVDTAYAPLFDLGGTGMSNEDLVNFFRVASSPSQAKNAARFFRAVAAMAGVDPAPTPAVPSPRVETEERPARAREQDGEAPERRLQRPPGASLAEAKARLLDKLPAAQPGWTAEEYAAICDRFLQMLAHLER